MFQVLTTEGVTLGYVDSPIYIKKSANGSFIQCDENEALGISFKSTPYHLTNKEPLDGSVEGVDITLCKVDGGEISFNNELNINNLTTQVKEITPYTVTKTAYIEDTEIEFSDIPDGTMSVSVKDSEGNYPDYTTERMGSRVVFHFTEPLTKVTTVTISVL